MDVQIIPSYDLLKEQLDKTWENLVQIRTDPELQLSFREGQENIVTDGTIGVFFEELEKILNEYKLPPLDRLGISIDFKEISDDAAKEIGKHLGTLKGLQSLELALKCKISDQGLKKIGNSISHLKDLERLKIEIYGSNQVTEKGIDDMILQLSSSLPVLTGFSLSLRELENVTDQVASAFSHHIKNFSNLSSLELALVRCVHITDKGITDLATNLGNDLKNLTFLSLSFRGCNKLTNEAVKSLIQQISQNIKSLRDLKLDFGDCHEITDQGLKDIAVHLVHFENLRKLTIWLTRCAQITDVAVRELGAQVSDFLRNLQEFNLDVSGKISDQSVKDLVFFVTNNLEQLESLHLEVTGQVTDQGLKDMAAHIANNIKKLKLLNLNFSGCPNITAESLINARNLLKDIPNLTIL